MKYYLHDSNAFQDEKVTELYMKFGYEGIGLFYTVLEKLAAQEKPVKTSVLKQQLFVGKKLEKCWQFLEEIGLISSNNGETFNEKLLNFSKKYQIKKDQNRERVAKFRENQVVKENVTHYNSITKRISNAPKVNKSKVNINKEENIKEESAEPKGSTPIGVNKKLLLNDKEEKFLNLFNQITGRKFATLNDKAKRQFKKLLSYEFKSSQFEKALNAGFKDSLNWPDPSKFTPEYITRDDKFDKYLNAGDVIASMATQVAALGNFKNIKERIAAQKLKD
jgi:hypothetical protein